MLEIIVLVFLTNQIGRMALRKGQKSWVWKLYTVLGWIVGEFIGVFAAVLAFNVTDYLSALPLAILGAVGGYLIVRAILSRIPDKPDEGFEFENKQEN